MFPGFSVARCFLCLDHRSHGQGLTACPLDFGQGRPDPLRAFGEPVRRARAVRVDPCCRGRLADRAPPPQADCDGRGRSTTGWAWREQLRVSRSASDAALSPTLDAQPGPDKEGARRHEADHLRPGPCRPGDGGLGPGACVARRSHAQVRSRMADAEAVSGSATEISAVHERLHEVGGRR